MCSSSVRGAVFLGRFWSVDRSTANYPFSQSEPLQVSKVRIRRRVQFNLSIDAYNVHMMDETKFVKFAFDAAE